MTALSSSSTEGLALPAAERVAGRLRVPPSKSETHRLLNLALLAGRPVVIEDPLLAEDTRLFLVALEALGLEMRLSDRVVALAPPRHPVAEAELACGNAGTLFRFLTAALTTMPGAWVLDGVARLRERPIGPLVEALRQLGAEIGYLGAAGHAPLRIRGATLAGGTCRLDAGESSQYLSALLMAARAAAAPVEVEVAALTSAPYVELTLRLLERAGVPVARPAEGRFRVEPGPIPLPERLTVGGDYSSACYLAAAAALTGGRVELEGLDPGTAQADRRFLDLLAAMGARVEWSDGVLEVAGRGLGGVAADLSAMPDQVPTLAALAPFARGVTQIDNVAHLRLKESDRLAAMGRELRRVGAAVEERADGLTVEGVWAERPPPASRVEVRAHGDHRIAMSLAVLALRRPGLVLDDPRAVVKSYPGFWEDWRRIGAR